MSERESAGPRRGRLKALVPGTRTHARPASELVSMLEATDPQGTTAAGLSSAAMRAADLVRSMRREAKLSQEDLAARIRVSQARISELEAGRGQQGPTWDVMDRIAIACGRELGVIPRTTGTSGISEIEDPFKLVEERLQIARRETLQGAVRVRSYIVERPVEQEVRLHEERVTIERRPIDHPAAATGAAAFQERVVEVQAITEEAVVAKEARVTEAIGISKDASDRTETVRDTVRQTKVEVDDQTAGAGRTGASAKTSGRT